MSEPANASEWRVRLLGRFEVSFDGRTTMDASWPYSKAKAIIKLLALQRNSTLHREQLIDALWPDSEPGAAANNLRQTFHRLLTRLAERGVRVPLVMTQGDLVKLASDAWLDIDAFRNKARAAREAARDVALYEAALDVYQGDLLPEDLYEEWTEAHREELEALRNELLSELAGLHETAGRSGLAEERLRELLKVDPFSENAHRSLMRLYASIGKRDRALRQYKACRDLLQHELEVEPSPETQELYRQIVEGRPASPEGTRATGPENAVLASSEPDAPRREYPLFARTAAIGRQRDNDIALDGSDISRHHARIEWTGSSYILQDLGSKNGTWVNESRLDGPAPLNDGDIVRFGNSSFVFKAIDQATLTSTYPRNT